MLADDCVRGMPCAFVFMFGHKMNLSTGKKRSLDQWLASSDLPEDLVIDQILSRLPVKSLMRFKSVCKRWHSLPTNPSFIASHLKHSNASNTLASWDGNNGLIVGHEGFRLFTVCSLKFAFQPVNLNFGFDRKPDLVLGPCDGVFCLHWRPIEFFSHGPLVERLPIIALWNPATRAFSILPMSKFDFPPYKKVYSCLVGFGFDLTAKSIKVVKVVNFRGVEAYQYVYINYAEVYDLSSGFWRVLPVDDTVQKVSVHDFPTHGMYNNNDGVFHWHSVRRFRGIGVPYIHLVLSFDISRELFHVTLMPEKFNALISSPRNRFKFCHFSLLRDSLADFCRVVEAGESFSSYSWSHESTVEHLCSEACVSTGFLNKNELLLWKIDLQLRYTPFLYDIVAKQARDLRELNFLYKESLVSVKGGCGNDSIPY
ncbi:putative F-box/kelch-repeat protein At1g12870 [Rhododendron vialii]|uniref:putative F-box/kelch-repeat protein At1g12870 n=1 Tax=Rhododendron vialii TaxID=182163 RepID=UPI00265ED242|nr:putative F-box/kelch-repeat protein At1g12870 [Rhododendron vialii]